MKDLDKQLSLIKKGKNLDKPVEPKLQPLTSSDQQKGSKP
eukprot:CAMPEP_0176340264 /NCGR_PEP_ID=MMETSP0126-20121128/1434_1 /TAXON_ID=141414 ORGANISM="Strombidinopsis acuminatum, Strain SPMC142" /NCGR_SAMPLE_ID=MMETSP0126 /ASSEMBLY_ACC=CAM_ASM_000229 /LENGTH=39 /DNA_ID= /DNA_START= /DNA_END= /DNA_ORIENTATION=